MAWYCMLECLEPALPGLCSLYRQCPTSSVILMKTQASYRKSTSATTSEDCSRICLRHFLGIDPDLLELTGCEVSVLSEQLKRVFGWNTRTTSDGIVSITERGNAVHAMHNVLTEFWGRYPENSVLHKWIFDVLKGAEKVYEVHDMTVYWSEFKFELDSDF